MKSKKNHKRVSRLYVDSTLQLGATLSLQDEAAHYLGRVLRLACDDEVILFNGSGGEYRTRIVAQTKKNLSLEILDFSALERESPLQITLVQGIGRSEHMDVVMQKATELGVQYIVPLKAQRSQRTDAKYLEKRQQHWQKIITSACEQCGRNRLPVLHPAQDLSHYLTAQSEQLGTKIVLSPTANITLSALPAQIQHIVLLIGPEGGFSDIEIAAIEAAGYTGVHLGKRILRTETAALSMLAVCQSRWGDWG
ncbi:16S rRNA (uracil(1498)-N(3))-methyltransferase [Candidatus Venteria ishoeyi]|uniref:Ribosomal RNA small subunit methyltransferase E n=1 Tax=Candidatus Venteria ishoeyi TaxID=1899563 RepID=A0A1H6FEM5_9GAMM|nr:16S rRNA (uracil(1498)-N(3))-methyltransferase [Candidatus Venteria ishoeyi]SEH07799.1 Ribosomal RNA small subunit methyltransferase E [Candidatus Venteria ishoeyi]